jgi:polysaccharide biosynthesis PFTS motif protein
VDEIWSKSNNRILLDEINGKSTNYIDFHRSSIVDFSNRHIKLSLKTKIYKFNEALFFLTLMGIAILKKKDISLINAKKINLIYSLSPEQIKQIGNPGTVKQFLEDSRFESQFLADYTIIENRSKSFLYNAKTTDEIEVFDIQTFLYAKLLTTSQKLKILFKSIKGIFVQFILRFNSLEILALKKISIDLIIWDAIKNQVHALNLVTTQSQLLAPTSAFYLCNQADAHKSMIWYSANNVSLHKIEPGKSRETRKLDPRADLIDLHFVWTSEQANSFDLKNYQRTSIKPVGSLLFYKPTENSIIRSKCYKKTTIFDVTPFAGEYDDTFYSLEIMESFIKDICASHSDIFDNFNLRLKPKRDYIKAKNLNIFHNQDYVQLLDTYQKAKMLTLLPADSNLYEVISMSDIVIGIPFTSPVLIAKELNIPCFYYAPDQAAMWDLPLTHEDIPVLRGYNNLQQAIEKEFNKLQQFEENQNGLKN